MKFVRYSFVIALIVSLVKFIQFIDIAPYGYWDSWAIWNPMAVFVYYGSPFTFSPQLPHPDYPLFLPGLTAVLWKFVGGPTPLVPILLCYIFTFGCFILLFIALRHFTNILLAYLFVGFLMVTPNFVWYGAAQMADIPLSFFILLTGICLVLSRKYDSKLWMIIAGIAAGIALHTKNEGALFVLVVMFYLVWVGRVASWRLSLTFLATVLPFLLLFIYFKIYVVPPNDIIGGAGISSYLPKLLDISRYGTIIHYMLAHLAPYYFVIVVLFGIVVTNQATRIVYEPVCLIVVLVLLGYCVIYLITPHDLLWHIVTSIERLLLHVWPLSLFCLGLMLQDKSKMLEQAKNALP
jgi:4-amino-4-deoxy-L-arabinose transferase-like glycosyltransferase